MISQKTIQEAIKLLKKAANPVKIILFGSYARGDITEDRDLDFLIIEKEVKARRTEMDGTTNTIAIRSGVQI